IKSLQETGLFASVLGKPLKQNLLRKSINGIFQPNDPAPSLKKTVQAFSEGVKTKEDLNILLVEDNAVNRKLAIRMMQKIGYEVAIATNGLEGFEAIISGNYHIVLMDVQMPVMDGLSATRKIRSEIPPDKQPVIIAMTANAMQGDRERCIEAGMNDYISKPFRMAELAAKLTEYGSKKIDVAD
ncbi:MAG: response regulator, partial [Bacteroidota bacterium]